MLSKDNRDIDLFDELDDGRARQVLDMHFYTAKYWRECISAFVTQVVPLMRTRVLTRLTEVIELENKIQEIYKRRRTIMCRPSVYTAAKRLQRVLNDPQVIYLN